MTGRERGQPAALQFSGIDRYEPGQHTGAGSPILTYWRICCAKPATCTALADQHRRGHPRLIANIYFYPIDTPLEQFVAAHGNLMRHCEAIHAAVTGPPVAARA